MQQHRRRTDTPPSGPWALRKPNSSNLQSGPAANLILAAFVVTRDAKFTRFNSDVSSSCASPMGPCTRSKGHFGKTTVPSRTACTVTSDASSARSQSKKPGSARGNSVLEVRDICIRYFEGFQVPNALVESRKHRELAPERILPEVELEDTFHFMSLMPPVRIGHAYLVKVRQERADQWVGRLARCHGCHVWFLWSLRRRCAALWLSGGRELAWAVRR